MRIGVEQLQKESERASSKDTALKFKERAIQTFAHSLASVYTDPACYQWAYRIAYQWGKKKSQK